MKVYVVWADTWNAPYGCNVSLFGVYSTKELVENAVIELRKERRTGMGKHPLSYYIAEFNMNECNEVYLDGYYE